MIAQALLLTLAVIAVTQTVCYAIWGGGGDYDVSVVVTGILIPAVTCFPISLLLLRQRNRMADLLARLELAHGELKERSSRDPMTGLLHRQAFFETLNHTAGEAGAVLVIDVDHFKSINDTYGHAVGDLALRSIAATLEAAAGTAATVARFGGEEFCAFLPLADEFGGLKLGEQIRRQVGQIEFSPNGARRRLTVSVGVALCRPGESIELAIGAADAALYEAKRAGRNRVVCSPAPTETQPTRDVA